MQKIKLSNETMALGAKLISDDTILYPAAGGGLSLPEIVQGNERYLVFFLELLEEHSGVFDLMFYKKGEEKQTINIRFGVMPGVKALICVDLDWIDAGTLFPGSTPGQLKVVCHGSRILREEVGKVLLKSHPCFHDVKVRLTDIHLTDEEPQEYPLEEKKLVDMFGQYQLKEWKNKIHSEDELKRAMEAAVAGGAEGPKEGFSAYGGCLNQKLNAGTGFFSKEKVGGKWFIADPIGHAFFSMGPDCVRPFADCRVTGTEKFLDWLPDSGDPEYAEFFSEHRASNKSAHRAVGKMPSYHMLNFHRVFGKNWFENWQRFVKNAILENGMNTLGNWSDDRILGTIGVPYVTSLPDFPSTKELIFRDFPDVLSDEYRENAKKSAEALAARRDDPYMIGYFLRNEPAWAFVDNLIIADEVLHYPKMTACKEVLIKFLQENYSTIENLNSAWNTGFEAFADLEKPLKKASDFSAKSRQDMRGFSKILLQNYVEIPSKACKKVDPNHMILGMRWAWISDPDIVSGWENFDVFSINCYAVDPTAALENVKNLGVDLPVMIGEFHFGALDAGLTATGLEAVKSQEDRGKAYRHYCEKVAAHPMGVGCHYFQFYDQFILGRFDGENYNIGLFDICSQPHTEMMDYVKACGTSVYEVLAGAEPYGEQVETIPMIAY